MNNIKFRTLYPSEIEVRPQNKAKNSDTKILLLYIDSRAVTTLLDETVGNLNWQNEFYEAGGLLFNKLSIRHPETGEWISRSETGSESTIEENKGKVSDTFKRCLSRFGVTELYSSPRIEVQDDGYGCTGYKVSEIAYDDNRKITHLVIVNRFGWEMARWDANTGQPKQVPVQAPIQPNTAPQQAQPVQQPQQYSKEALIENIRANANVEASLPNANIGMLKKFVEYYTNRISNNDWNGNFDFSVMWQKWQKRGLN
ncbi:MAG: hypothetical protein IIU90_00115 [Bacteroidaceae bacterium]|nr:hypothetical protein [Bacteroidaceae bacterium]